MSQATTAQFTTFHIGENLYGIEVMRVQEVTGNLPTISVPLAPKFVRGLINLRGQIATAIGLRELFGISTQKIGNEVSVVCKIEGNLVSLLVDSIGDVMEIPESQFEPPPAVVPPGVKKFLKGVYKTEGSILSVVDLEELSKELSQEIEKTETKNLNQ